MKSTVEVDLVVQEETTILIGHLIARTPDDKITIIGSGKTLRFNIKNAAGELVVIDVDLGVLADAAVKLANES